jgi:hypothetical protein
VVYNLIWGKKDLYRISMGKAGTWKKEGGKKIELSGAYGSRL